MNVKKIITILVGGVIAFALLAFMISFVSNSSSVKNSTDAVFVSTPDQQTAVVNPGGLISEKGSLKFGRFALFQLINEETALEFISAEFDEKTESISHARGRVNSGSVLAVNLLFGNKLTLLDDRVAAVNHGGSFVFEKDAEAKSSHIRVLSGATKITLINKDNSEMFEGILLAGEEVELTDEEIVEIFAAKDEISKISTWNEKIEGFGSKFEGESRLTSDILDKLPRGKPNSLVAGINFVREKILFNPTVIESFYEQKLAGLIAEAASGNADELNNFLAESDEKKHVLFQTVTARATPLTRLFLVKSLAPSLKEKIWRLADFSKPFSTFAEISDLSHTDELNRNLIFISDDPSNTKYTRKFLNQVKSGTIESNSETAELLLASLTLDAKMVDAEWLEAWSTINRARIVTDLGLASAISDQLTLVKFLVESGREDVAGSALKGLVGLITSAKDKFSATSLEKIATEGNELKNRILFLVSLRDEAEFDEEAYRAWLVEREKTETEEAEQTEPAEDPAPAEEPALDTSHLRVPGRVVRPQSELEKFLHFDLPISPTQAAEEEKQEDLVVMASGIFESCGTSEGPINSIDAESDAALVCLGRNMIDGCKSSQATLQTTNAGAIKISLEGGTPTACSILMEYGSEDQITLDDQKQYADKFMLCSINLDAMNTESLESGIFAKNIFTFMNSELLNPDTKCEGTVFGN